MPGHACRRRHRAVLAPGARAAPPARSLDQVAAVAATGRVEQVGVAARHRRAAARAPGGPPSRSATCRCPAPALYETWHRLRRPAVERATGPVDVVHATGYAIPPRTAPLVVTLHDLAWRRDPSMFTAQRRALLRGGAALRGGRRRPGPVPVAGDARRLRRRRHRARTACATCPGAWTRRPSTRHRGRRGPRAPALRAHRPLRAVGGHARAPQEPAPPARRVRPPAGAASRRDARRRRPGRAGASRCGARGRRAGRPAAAHGLRPPRELAPLYRGAAVVCYPSLWEGFGLPVAEAMAAGAPVVTSAGTATEELVAGGAGLAVDPRDADAIAGALASVLDDDDLADRLRRGRARAGGRDHVGGHGGARPSPPTRRWLGTMRVGCNLLWLVPGVVGGSETATVSLLREIADAPARRRRADARTRSTPSPRPTPTWSSAFPTRLVPPDRAPQAAAGGGREHVAGPPGPRDGLDLVHHMGGVAARWSGPHPGVVTIHDLQPFDMPDNFYAGQAGYLHRSIPRSVRRAAAGAHAQRVRPPGRRRPVRRGPRPGAGSRRGASSAPSTEVTRRRGPGPLRPAPALVRVPGDHLAPQEPRPAAAGVRHGGGPGARRDAGADRRRGPGRAASRATRSPASGLRGRVRRTGRIPRRDVLAIVRGAVALTFPSRYEGFGLPVLEAMSLGTPVLVGRRRRPARGGRRRGPTARPPTTPTPGARP